jgi:hypothetical protein
MMKRRDDHHAGAEHWTMLRFDTVLPKRGIVVQRPCCVCVPGRNGLVVEALEIDVFVIGATAIAATVSDPSVFESGREFAAWIRLVPRQKLDRWQGAAGLDFAKLAAVALANKTARIARSARPRLDLPRTGSGGNALTG